MSPWRILTIITAAFFIGVLLGWYIPGRLFATPAADVYIGGVGMNAHEAATVLNLVNDGKLDVARQVLEAHLKGFIGAAPTLRKSPLSEKGRATLEENLVRAEQALSRKTNGAAVAGEEKK